MEVIGVFNNIDSIDKRDRLRISCSPFGKGVLYKGVVLHHVRFNLLKNKRHNFRRFVWSVKNDVNRFSFEFSCCFSESIQKVWNIYEGKLQLHAIKQTNYI